MRNSSSWQRQYKTTRTYCGFGFQIVKMLIVLTVIFGVCWLPYHAYFLVLYYFPSISFAAGIQHVFLAFYWLAMSHATVNPAVYFLMNPTYASS